MIGWAVRLLLFFSGFIAGAIVSRDALNFPIIQMVVAVLLFVIMVAVVALWPKGRRIKDTDNGSV